MSETLLKWVLGLVAAGLLALGSWVYATGNRLAAVETAQSVAGQATNRAIQDIRDDLRDLRRALLGPKKEHGE